MKKFFTLSIIALFYFTQASASSDSLTGCWVLKDISIIEYNQMTGEVIANISISQLEINNPLSKELSDIVISSFCISDDGFILTAKNGKTYIGEAKESKSQLSIEAVSMDGKDTYKEVFYLSKNENKEISLEKDYYTNRENRTKAKIRITLIR